MSANSPHFCYPLQIPLIYANVSPGNIAIFPGDTYGIMHKIGGFVGDMQKSAGFARGIAVLCINYGYMQSINEKNLHRIWGRPGAAAPMDPCGSLAEIHVASMGSCAWIPHGVA